MKDKNKIIAALVMSIFGIMGVFATLISMPEDLEYLKTIFIVVGIALLIIAAFFYTAFYIDLTNAFSILRNVKKLGIKSIKENGIGGSNFKNHLKNAKSIKMISTTGLVFFRSCEEELISALVNNARISLILSSSNSEFNNETEEIEKRNRGEIDNELKQVSTVLSRFLREAAKRTDNQSTGVISIKYFNTHLRLPMILIDDNFVWLTLTLPPNRSTQSHSIEIENKESSLALSCNNHFNELWTSLQNEKNIEITMHNNV